MIFMTIDCYEFYLWSVGELPLPIDVARDLISRTIRKEDEI